VIKVIPYSDAHLAAVTRLVEEFHVESLAEFGLSIDGSGDIAAQMALHGESSFLLTADGSVVGAILGVVENQPMSARSVYHESMWYVQPAHRGHGIRLIRHLEDWCMSIGVDQIIMAHMGSASERLSKLFIRRGYKPMEVSYIRDLKAGVAHA